MTIRYTEAVDVFDVETFIQGVLSTLRYWRDVHSEPAAWATMWLGESENREGNITLSDICLKNSYFSVSEGYFKTKIAESIIEESGCASYYCTECGNEDEEKICEECGAECYDNKDPDNISDNLDVAPYRIVFNVMRDFIFPDYYAAVSPVFAGPMEQVEHYISKIESETNKFDLLAATVQALSIAHVNGEIFCDYLHCGAYGIEFEDILTIRENGLESHFEPEEIKEFLDS